jgi:hypothetical protein
VRGWSSSHTNFVAAETRRALVTASSLTPTYRARSGCHIVGSTPCVLLSLATALPSCSLPDRLHKHTTPPSGALILFLLTPLHSPPSLGRNHHHHHHHTTTPLVQPQSKHLAASAPANRHTHRTTPPSLASDPHVFQCARPSPLSVLRVTDPTTAMAALVAYPVASRLDRGSRRPRTPQSRIGWDERRHGLFSHIETCERDFAVACMYLQCAFLQVLAEQCELSSYQDVCVHDVFSG